MLRHISLGQFYILELPISTRDQQTFPIIANNMDTISTVD